MALATARPPRLVILAAAVLTLASAAACGGRTGPAPSTSSPVAQPSSPARTSSAAVNLSGVLIQPAGFVAVSNDAVSGPLQTETDVRKFFTDRPSDPAEILGHGFAGGYVRQWQVSQNPPSSGATVVVAPILLEIVLQFDTAAHAMAVEQYFRHAPQPWPVKSFAVPSRLTAGYGQYQVQGSGSAATYLYAVVWVSRDRLFEAGIDYSARQKSPAQVISVAVAQNRA